MKSHPRFTVHVGSEKKISVWDDDFGYDAALAVSGDFGSMESVMRYAQAVADALNIAAIPIRREQPDDDL